MPCVKPGGRIVYSTCSIDPEENRELIDRFLDQHSDWKLDAEYSALPFIDSSDGAYAARLIKAEP